MIARTTLFTLLLTTMTLGQTLTSMQSKHVPTIDELMLVQTVGGTQISPDGKWVAYTVNGTDFKTDTHPSQIWLANAATGERFQLTAGPKSASNPRWTPDGQWLGFLSNRVDDKNQVFAIRPTGGEALQLSKHDTGVNGFAWSLDGKTIAYTATEPATPTAKDREERFSKYEVVRRDYAFVHLWTLEVAAAMRAPAAGTQQTMGKDFSVTSFSWSPDNTHVAFGATINPDLIQGNTSDIYLLNVSDRAVRKIVSLPGSDSNPQFSPDGKMIVFQSVLGKTTFGIDSRLAVMPVEGGPARSITDDFDEDPSFVAWNADGIYFAGSQKTASHLFRTNPSSPKAVRVSSPDNLMANGFSLTPNGKTLAFTASSPASLAEVYVTSAQTFAPKPLTDMTAQVRNFTLGTREVVSWKSKDGATIEGILIKPANFDPSKKYPLLAVIHGGPSGIDRPGLLSGDTRYYPADIWAARGALILKVNYRGSVGYGEAFHRLNIRNLGVGDAWDVNSGVDYLIGKGWVDPNKVACMGWSQGGYISAFLTTSSTRFAAISVGAGISDWSTYYYNTDITNFTLNYLGDNPVNDPEIYQKTSPITYIKGAKTPTLIQQGELDKRVPIANSYELRQALEDRKVPVEMVVYKGFGHGINKPKAMRAVMEHNLGWFNHYIFGDPMPDFVDPAKKSSN